jgi:hypothetical protein
MGDADSIARSFWVFTLQNAKKSRSQDAFPAISDV